MSVAVMTDSNSGITQAQSKELGIFVLPMPFIIDGEVLLEDKDFDREDFYQKLTGGSDISTSQPAPGSVIEMYDRILEEYDELVHIPMSAALSTTYETAHMLAQDYDGRVQVVDNRRISITQRQSALDAAELARRGWGAAQIREHLDKTISDSVIYALLDTLKYLKKGGRITPAAAALGTLLQLKPVLIVNGGKLDAFAKARTRKQGKSLMVAAIKKDLAERFHDPEAEHTWLEVVHGACLEDALEMKAELEAAFPKTGEIFLDHMSLSIATHVGPGTLGVAATVMLRA
ncbi:MAG: DegV family protein [Lachnospiraceae bacterium]|jgi:DegV family protein with EDD domain|nr:DegV family protein [Lachnospiraceae bacterium]